jgi:rubrerythrin
MGKTYRDKHNALKKRKIIKKGKNKIKISCNVCGTKTRPQKLTKGLCPICLNK